MGESPGDPRRPVAWLGLLEALLDGGRFARAGDASRKALTDPSILADPAVLETLALQGIEAARQLSDADAEAAFWSVLAAKAKTEDLRTRARFAESLDDVDGRERR